VGKTAMNHMAGQSLPNYRLLNLRYGERFVPQDMDQVQVLPSGLTKPVLIVVSSRCLTYVGRSFSCGVTQSRPRAS